MRKKYEINYLPIAVSDLEEIIEYIKIDNPDAALNMLNTIDEAISKLKDFSEIGVIPKDKRLKRLGYRIKVCKNYLVFYVIKENIIEIRRILHGKRNYEFLL